MLEQTPNPKKLVGEDALYAYKELKGSGQIRILKLFPTKDRIECNIHHINCSDGGYQAISYVWGSQNQPFKAHVRGSDGDDQGYIPLTENLEQALTNLRDSKELENNVFWIDQVCINQKGKEKSSQVTMMHQIFRNAQSVITYLGPAAADAEEEERGIALMYRLDKHFEKNYEIMAAEKSLDYARLRNEEFPVRTLPPELEDGIEPYFCVEVEAERYVAEGWKWLVETAYGDWGLRLWIVQEQHFNEERMMLRGQRLLSWDSVTSMTVLFGIGMLPIRYVTEFWQMRHPNSLSNPNQLANSVFYFWNHRQRSKRGISIEDDETLLENMSRYANALCQDPRDRIFALLPVSCDAADLEIVPDYSDNTTSSALFHRASVRILQGAKNLNLLRNSCHLVTPELPGNDKASRPSWSLDYMVFRTPNHWIRPDACSPHPYAALLKPLEFAADDSVLKLKGSILDRVATSSPPIVIPSSAWNGLPDEANAASQAMISSNLNSIFSQLEATIENAAQVCRALIGIPDLHIKLPPNDLVNDVAAFHLLCFYRYANNVARNYCISSPPNHEEIVEKGKQIAKVLGDSIYKDEEDFDPDRDFRMNEVETLRRIMDNFLLHGRALGITEKGRVCNAMNHAKNGDAIAAFQGSERLYVLRPVGGKYRLVGDAYVDGFMKGEAYEGVNPDNVDHDIELI